MGLSTLAKHHDWFNHHYQRFLSRYLNMDMMRLQILRCSLQQELGSASQRYRYDVRFWAKYYAAEDAYYQSFAKAVGFKGTLDPCTWPSRESGTRVYARSGTLLYASVDTGEVGVPFAKRRRVPKGGDKPSPYPDR